MADFSRLTVRGVFDQDNIKNFEIKDKESGEIFMAVRSGSKFELGDFRGTLAECKQKVIDGYSEHFADVVEAPVAADGMWDHCDPLALLCLFEIPAHISPLVHETLDAHGWVKPDGSRDVELANKTVQDYLKRKKK